MSCHFPLLFACCLISLMICPVAAETIDVPESGVEPAAAYVDQLIDPQTAGSELFPGYEDVQEPEGYRSFSTEYRHYQQDLGRAGKFYEDGIILHGQRQTRDYGEFEMLATVRADRPADIAGRDDATGGRLTLRQYGFAANENWLLDNSLGILRSDADPVLSSSYRVNLPSTLVSGLKNWSRNGRTDFRFSAGKIGTLGVGQIQDFDTTSGTLASMGLSQSLSRNWLVTGQVIAINDSDDVPG